MGADPAPRAEGQDADLALRRAVLPAGGGSRRARRTPRTTGPSAGAWPEDVQRRLLADCLFLARASRIPVEAPGGGRVDLPLHAAVRFLLLPDEEGD